MKKKLSKKLLFIIAMLAVVATLFTACGGDEKDTKDATTTTSSTKDSDSSNDSSSEDALGLCSLIEKDTVKTAIGTNADNLADPVSTGVQSLGDGDEGSTCIFGFDSDSSVNNSFYIDLAKYSESSFKDISDFTGKSGEDVSGVGDSAKFEANESLTGTQEYTITAIKGTNVYLFVISQPKDKVSIDEATAKTALTTIAQSASLK